MPKMPDIRRRLMQIPVGLSRALVSADYLTKSSPPSACSAVHHDVVSHGGYPPVDYSQEPAAARAARQRRVQAQVDDLLTPINPADIAYRYFLR